jgi:DNA-directed RNA polymerase subunit beta'
VGIIAAQSIGEPGTQLTMRTFHIGGTASRVVEASKHEAKSAGLVKYHNLRTVVNRDGDLVATNRNGEIAIADERGRERERYPVVYGAKIKVKAEQKVKQRTVLVEWDPFTNPILTEFTGRVEYQDIIDPQEAEEATKRGEIRNATVREEFDDVTGLARKVVVEDPDGRLQPGVVIRGIEAPEGVARGATEVRYAIPVGAHLTVANGTDVFAADIIAKIPRESTKTKDITGGLPRVAELFEARKPKEQAVITEIDGRVEMGGFVKGMRKIVIRADNGETREYLIPRGKHISVHEGDRVRAGEPLMDGSPNPHDYLAVLGDRELQKYLVNEVQEVYRLQGVTINDKHIEIIVRQMLRRVRIEEVGDTEFVVGELVDKFVFQEENDRVLAQGKRPATAKPVLLGITKASLSTDSFISAASFQETTRVLTEAAISGKVDDLRGLKENVIVGRLIPAGTGLGNYTSVEVLTPGGEALKPLDSVLSLEPPPDPGDGDGSIAAAG